MNAAMAHPLVARLAQVQLDLRSDVDKADAAQIDASQEFIRRRVLSASHARGRALLTWAQAQGQDRSPSFVALSTAIASGEPIAELLMRCWADFPECQEVA